MDEHARITRLGIALIGLLVAGVASLFFGSRALQAIGFVVVVLVILLLIGGSLPRMRVFGGGPWRRDHQDAPSGTRAGDEGRPPRRAP